MYRDQGHTFVSCSTTRERGGGGPDSLRLRSKGSRLPDLIFIVGDAFRSDYAVAEGRL